MRRLPFLLVFILGCQSISGPSDAYHSIIEAEFAIAQEKVAREYTIQAWAVSVGDFSWQRHNGPFMCGDELANGCFHYPSRTITWNVQTPQVIRHEAGHALLYALGYYDKWRCYEHGC